MMKKLFAIVMALLSGFGLYAQPIGGSNDVLPGANDAKTVILRKATFGAPEWMSEDARYICGLYGSESGFVYDFEKDTCLVFLEYDVAGYVSPDHYVGYWFTYYNGEFSQLLNKDNPEDYSVSAQAVQGNCNKIVTMVYDNYTTASGLVKHMNHAAIHDGKTGRHLFSLPYAWPVPEDDEAKLRFGSRGDCISGDGAIVGGHSTNLKAFS
ncbi:MAG: hypothetical protein K2I84_01055, partial [Bacteroidales bacterium]|nr:hypothetical protein [Bacteroidales bacterium]